MWRERARQPFWTRVHRPSRASTTPYAGDVPAPDRDEGADISLLTSRFRAPALSRAYERARAHEDSTLFLTMSVMLTLALGVNVLSSHAAAARPHNMPAAEIALLALLGVLWLVRLLMLGLYARAHVSRLALELATTCEVVARIALRAAVTIPLAFADDNHGIEAAAHLELAASAMEVAALARYELAPPVCGAVVVLELVAAFDPLRADSMRIALSVCAFALLTLPLLLGHELTKRRAWLERRRLCWLRQEVSHFGLNHLYHASSTIDLALERAEEAGPTHKAWASPALSSVADTLDAVTKVLRLICDDTVSSAEARQAEFSLDDFAAIAFRGIVHTVEPSAEGRRARFDSWAARAILADVAAVGRQRSSAALLGGLLLHEARGQLVLRLWARTDGVDLNPPARRIAARHPSSEGGGSFGRRGSATPTESPPAELLHDAHEGDAPKGVTRGPLSHAAESARAAGGTLEVRHDENREWALIELSMPVAGVRDSMSRSAQPFGRAMPDALPGRVASAAGDAPGGPRHPPLLVCGPPGLPIVIDRSSAASTATASSPARDAIRQLRAAASRLRRHSSGAIDLGMHTRTQQGLRAHGCRLSSRSSRGSGRSSFEFGSPIAQAALSDASAAAFGGSTVGADAHDCAAPYAGYHPGIPLCVASALPEPTHARALPDAAAPPTRNVPGQALPTAAAAIKALVEPDPAYRPPAVSAESAATRSPMPTKHIGIDRARFREPATAAERAWRILVVLDNHLDPPGWKGELTGRHVARRLRELGSDATVVLHTACSPVEQAQLVAEGCLDAVTLKDRAGREHVCNLCAQHDLCVFVDDMQMVLTSIDLALGKQLYNKVRSPAPGDGWLATANAHVRYAMISRESELDLVYAVCMHELVFDDNLLVWAPKSPGPSATSGPATASCPASSAISSRLDSAPSTSNIALSPSLDEHVLAASRAREPC